MQSKTKQNLSVGIIFLAVAALVFWGTSGLAAESSMLPMLCASLVALFGLLLIAGALREVLITRKVVPTPAISSGSGGATPLALLDTIVVSVALVATSLVIPVLGFYTTITVFILCIRLFYGKELSFKSVASSVLFTLAVIAVLFLVFQYLMSLPTPTGLFL